MKTVCITGAGGYLGSRMVEYYLFRGWSVIALDRFYFGSVLDDIKKKNLRIERADIRSFPENILKSVDVVIHLASISNDPAADLDPGLTRSINYEGAVRTAKVAKKMAVKQFIFASSCSIYGHNEGIVNERDVPHPLTEYARSKLAAEKEILRLANHTFTVTVLRLATLYGLSSKRMRFDLVINLMTLHAWKKNKILIMGGGKHWRPVIHLDDAIAACFAISNRSSRGRLNGQILNVGTNDQNFQIYQIGYIFKKYFPGLLIEEIPSDPEKRSYRVSFDKVKSILQFSPKKSIGDGIREIKEALERGVIKDDIRTKTLNYYQYLIDADTLLTSIKINNRLF